MKRKTSFSSYAFFFALCISLETQAAPETEFRHNSESEGFVELENGQTLHYLSRGTQGSDPLLLFIHGAPERAEVWRDYMRYFSRDFFTVAYTSRGYFPSSIPAGVESYDTLRLAEDAVAVAEAFGYDRFTVVGHDWGGATAWQIAINFPEMVDKLVVIANPHPIMYSRAYYESDEHRELLDAYIPLARDDIAPWNRRATLENDVAHFKDVYTARERDAISWSQALLFEETWRYNDGESIEAIYHHYKALDWPLTTLNTCNPAPTISLKVQQPVLQIYGTEDRFVSEDAFLLPNNDCHPNTISVPIEGAGHFIHHQYKSYLTRLMYYFLAD